MAPARRHKLARLARCRMLPGSRDKRFVRGLAGRPEVELSSKQAEMVDKLWHKYRRQLRNAAEVQ